MATHKRGGTALRGSELDARLDQLLQRELSCASSAPGDVSRMFFAKSRIINPLGLRPDIVDRIAGALTQQRRIKARYEHFDGKETDLVIEPYTLIFTDEGLYLYGRCADSDEARYIDSRRMYALERFTTVVPAKERFRYPNRDEYDPAQVFQHCIGVFIPPEDNARPEDVVLSFDARWRFYLNRHRWHISQSRPYESKGRFQIKLHLHVTQDLIRWLRSFGDDVKVTKPRRLATWIRTGQDPDMKERWG